ncbi:hypothetical protein AB1207_24050 [Kineococcus endophyticus]|uniref:Uncharacterized protein n=1 Tax=Kineococcus endophyticus TaxID=1181883 RepID=A0ABV3PDV8_9ACTN
MSETAADYFAQRSPREVARDDIARAVRDCADAELGIPSMGESAEAIRENRAAYADPSTRAAIELRCVEVAHHFGLDLAGWLTNARIAHVSWRELAAAIGLNEDQAVERYPHVDGAAESISGAVAYPPVGWDDAAGGVIHDSGQWADAEAETVRRAEAETVRRAEERRR